MIFGWDFNFEADFDGVFDTIYTEYILNIQFISIARNLAKQWAINYISVRFGSARFCAITQLFCFRVRVVLCCLFFLIFIFVISSPKILILILIYSNSTSNNQSFTLTRVPFFLFSLIFIVLQFQVCRVLLANCYSSRVQLYYLLKNIDIYIGCNFLSLSLFFIACSQSLNKHYC